MAANGRIAGIVWLYSMTARGLQEPRDKAKKRNKPNTTAVKLSGNDTAFKIKRVAEAPEKGKDKEKKAKKVTVTVFGLKENANYRVRGYNTWTGEVLPHCKKWSDVITSDADGKLAFEVSAQDFEQSKPKADKDKE